jgi:adenosylcobinamide kinase / adenosylcobinamide-phosphate guanylyltransferase
VVYVATATALDGEMAERIARHRAQRPASWRTLEEPLRVAARVEAELAAAPEMHLSTAPTVVVEDLTLLLSNLMLESEVEAETQAVAEVSRLLDLSAHVILVSNEVGMGIVPPYPVGRVFRDALGRVNQSAAAACAEVYLVVAGLTLRLK